MFQCQNHCTITSFGFHARQIDGVKCGLFSNHAHYGNYVWDEYLYSILEKVEVRVTVSVIVLCGVMMKGREKVKPGAGS